MFKERDEWEAEGETDREREREQRKTFRGRNGATRNVRRKWLASHKKLTRAVGLLHKMRAWHSTAYT